MRHIVHDFAYLVVAGEDTQRGLAGPYNHYAERTFLVHCRSFAKFFSNESDGRDMYARDFVDGMPGIMLPVWTIWAKHVDQHLMHLTKARITNTTPWTGAQNKDFLREFRAAWGAFYGALKPALKPKFDEELADKQAEMPQIRLV